MKSPAEFLRQVKSELKKVTWPTRTETTGMTVAVLVMVTISMGYFLICDWIVFNAVQKLIGY